MLLSQTYRFTIKTARPRQICVPYAMFFPAYPQAFFFINHFALRETEQNCNRWATWCTDCTDEVTACAKYLSIHISTPLLSLSLFLSLHPSTEKLSASPSHSKSPRGELKSRARRPNVFLGGLNAGESGDTMEIRGHRGSTERRRTCARTHLRARRYTSEES